MFDLYDNDFEKAFDEAVDAIERKASEKKHGRLIDADKLIELIDDDISTLDIIDMSREGYDVCLCTLKMVKQYIKALPTVEPTKHGRWGRWKGKPIAGFATVRCSICGTAYLENDGRWDYCPNCGARMDLDEVEK